MLRLVSDGYDASIRSNWGWTMTAGARPEIDRKAHEADLVTARLTEAGFPQTAQTTWWMLLIDPEVNQTPFRVWDSEDFETLHHLVDKTLAHPAVYLQEIEEVTSTHFAAQLESNSFIANRLAESEQSSS
jgi:hypothetical protein